MSFASEVEHIKAARVPHQCSWCNEAISKGEPYERWRWYDSGDASTCRMHPECSKACSEWCAEYDEHEFDTNENRRGCNCFRDPGCPKCAARKALAGEEAA